MPCPAARIVAILDESDEPEKCGWWIGPVAKGEQPWVQCHSWEAFFGLEVGILWLLAAMSGY